MKYTDSLFNGRGSKAKLAFRKMSWSMYRAEDVVKLEQRLQSHLDALHRYLTAINIQIQAQSAEKADKKLDKLDRTLDEVHTLVKFTQENRPKMLGYPWEVDMASHVEFEDALGRKVILPNVLCRSAQVFQDTLQIMFANHPGHQTIADRRYEIVDANTDLAILHAALDFPRDDSGLSALQDRWKQYVLPGAKLAMNIISKKRIRDSPDFLVPTIPKNVPCPSCGWHNCGRGLRKW